MKNQVQITEAIDRLYKNKRCTKELSFFGENNHQAIDAGIETLLCNLDEDDLYDKLDTEEWDQHEYDFAEAILGWKNSNDSLDDYLYPEE